MICHFATEACKNAEAVVIATEWKEFLDIDWEVYKGTNKPAFVFRLAWMVFTLTCLDSIE